MQILDANITLELEWPAIRLVTDQHIANIAV